MPEPGDRAILDDCPCGACRPVSAAVHAGPSPLARALRDVMGDPRSYVPPSFGPEEVLDAVGAMDAGQLAELRERLGIAAAHPLLVLPGPDGRPVEPAYRSQPRWPR
jgi:hypothetical protein